MNEITSEQVLAALRGVRHPHRDDDLVGLGMISGVVVKNGNVGFAIEVHPAEAQSLEPVRKCGRAVRAARRDLLFGRADGRTCAGRSTGRRSATLGGAPRAAQAPLVPG